MAWTWPTPSVTSATVNLLSFSFSLYLSLSLSFSAFLSLSARPTWPHHAPRTETQSNVCFILPTCLFLSAYYADSFTILIVDMYAEMYAIDLPLTYLDLPLTYLDPTHSEGNKLVAETERYTLVLQATVSARRATPRRATLPQPAASPSNSAHVLPPLFLFFSTSSSYHFFSEFTILSSSICRVTGHSVLCVYVYTCVCVLPQRISRSRRSRGQTRRR